MRKIYGYDHASPEIAHHSLHNCHLTQKGNS
jgi:hypothetical protein